MEPELVVVTGLVAQRGGTASHPVDFYEEGLRRLAGTGVPVLAFLDPALGLAIGAPNLRILPVAAGDLPTVRALERLARDGIDPVLPAGRNPAKDTADYLAIVNAKPWLVARAISLGYAARRFAWIDAGLLAHCTRVELAQERIRGLAAADPGRLWIPGIAPRAEPVVDAVHWRYCGGLVLGGPARLLAFAERCAAAYAELLPRLTWDVNLWALLELRGELDARWWRADHDESMLALPAA